MASTTNEYFVFISYKREDEGWAKWVQHELEHYRLPVSITKEKNISDNLRPVFRDIDELSAGNLPQQISTALDLSSNLVVICSPLSANSVWVNKEVQYFIEIGRVDHIFPFIVEGTPDVSFPPALRSLPSSQERLGGNVNEKGRDSALVKIIAGMLGIRYDSLWNRYEREKADEERKIREQRDKLLVLQSKVLSFRASSLLEDGRQDLACVLALEALPKDINDINDRPYVPEAENVLRKAYLDLSPFFVDIPRVRYRQYRLCFDCSRDKSKIATIDKGVITIAETENGRIINTINLSKKLEGASGQEFVRFRYFNEKETLVVQYIPSVGFIEYDFHSLSLHLIEVSGDDSLIRNLGEIEGHNKAQGKFTLTDISISPNGEYIVCAACTEDPNSQFQLCTEKYLMKTFNLLNKALKSQIVFDTYSENLLGEEYGQFSVSISADNSYLAISCGGDIFVYYLPEMLQCSTISNQERLCYFGENTDEIITYSGSVNGSFIICAIDYHSYESRTVYDSQIPIREFICDSGVLAVLGDDGTTTIIDLEFGVIVARKHFHRNIHLVSISAQKSSLFYSVDGRICAWDYRFLSGREILYYHKDAYYTSTYGNHIISQSDRLIRVWNYRTKAEIISLNIALPPIWNPVLNPSSLRIACYTHKLFSENPPILYLIDGRNNTVREVSLKLAPMNVSFSKFGNFVVYREFNELTVLNFSNPQKLISISLFEYSADKNTHFSEDEFIAKFSDNELFLLITYKNKCQLWKMDEAICISNIHLMDSIKSQDEIDFTPDCQEIIINNAIAINLFTGDKRDVNYGKRIDQSHSLDSNNVIVENGFVLMQMPCKSLQNLIDETRVKIANRQLSESETEEFKDIIV